MDELWFEISLAIAIMLLALLPEQKFGGRPFNVAMIQVYVGYLRSAAVMNKLKSYIET